MSRARSSRANRILVSGTGAYRIYGRLDDALVREGLRATRTSD